MVRVCTTGTLLTRLADGLQVEMSLHGIACVMRIPLFGWDARWEWSNHSCVALQHIVFLCCWLLGLYMVAVRQIPQRSVQGTTSLE